MKNSKKCFECFSKMSMKKGWLFENHPMNWICASSFS